MSRKLAVMALGGLLGLASLAAVAEEPAEVYDGVLVGEGDMTLYVFDKDAPGSGRSACNGPCAENWPPFAASADAEPEGGFTVITRDDGAAQWAYQGRPLYYWVKDQKPGDMTGDGVKEVWHVARP